MKPSLVLAAQQGKNPKTLEAYGKKPAVLAFAECRTRNAFRLLCPLEFNIPIWNILFVARRSGYWLAGWFEELCLLFLLTDY